jgi:hypothetical protein
MAGYEYDEATANEATGFSGFGGHLLAQAADAAPNVRDENATLAALGIEDVEQLVAIAAIPEVREELQSVLRLENEDFQRLVAQARETLPAERSALVSAPAPREFGLGVLPPTPEMIAAAEASAAEASAVERAVEEGALEAPPPSANLLSYMSDIRSQAARGTCVSFTLTALNEAVLRRRGHSQNLSEQHLYYEIKLVDGRTNACGTWQVDAPSGVAGMDALRDRGQCREHIWPYNPNPPCNNHGVRPRQARPDGLNYRLTTSTVPTRNVLAYKEHMSQQQPVTLSIPVYNSWYQSAETRRSGRITLRVGNEPAVGGHAVLLAGYQDARSSPGGGYFIVRNSWGLGWGSQCPYGAGYGTIPYRYIINDAWEAVTA